MQIQNVNTCISNTTFSGIYHKKINFTNHQLQLVEEVKSNLNHSLSCHNKQKLVDYYQKRGFDFIIKPEEKIGIKVYATNKFSRIKWFLKSDYIDKGLFIIGNYYKKNINDFRTNLFENNPMFNIMSRY